MAKWTDERAPYLQVAADLRAKIMSGDLAGKLPTVKDLMVTYGTKSNSVVQRAMEMLGDEGFVSTERGRGNFVRAEQVAAIEAMPQINLGGGEQKSRYQLLEVADAAPPADAARALGILPGAVAAMRKQVLIRADGVPVELVWNYFRAEDARGTALVEPRLIRGGSKAVFAAAGRIQSEMDDVMTTRQPTTPEVEILELPIGVPVLRVLRTISDQNAEPMEVNVIVKGGHLYAQRHRSVID